MQNIRHNHRVIFDVIMNEDGSLTAENINAHIDTVRVSQAAKTSKLHATDDIVKKGSAMDDECASISTKATTVPEATPEPVNPELRKLTKKLREIEELEGRQGLNESQRAKVAMKQEFQERLKKLT